MHMETYKDFLVTFFIVAKRKASKKEIFLNGGKMNTFSVNEYIIFTDIFYVCQHYNIETLQNYNITFS